MSLLNPVDRNSYDSDYISNMIRFLAASPYASLYKDAISTAERKHLLMYERQAMQLGPQCGRQRQG